MFNGMLIAHIRLKVHLPSHLKIAGNDAFLSYDGQNQTCYRCNETGYERED